MASKSSVKGVRPYMAKCKISGLHGRVYSRRSIVFATEDEYQELEHALIPMSEDDFPVPASLVKPGGMDEPVDDRKIQNAEKKRLADAKKRAATQDTSTETPKLSAKNPAVAMSDEERQRLLAAMDDDASGDDAPSDEPHDLPEGFPHKDVWADNGVTTVEGVLALSDEEVAEGVKGIGPARLRESRDYAKVYLRDGKVDLPE